MHELVLGPGGHIVDLDALTLQVLSLLSHPANVDVSTFTRLALHLQVILFTLVHSHFHLYFLAFAIVIVIVIVFVFAFVPV